MADVNYNRRAFLYGASVFILGVFFMLLGSMYFDGVISTNLIILGSILSIVGILSLFILGGLIFSLSLYSEDDF